MKLDTSIIEMYLNREISSVIRKHWVFSSIREGEILFEMPAFDKLGKVRSVYEQILASLSCFQIRNKKLFDRIFPNIDTNGGGDVCVYLIVGAPAPYDAMCREDNNGRVCIIFDLIRISDYCSSFNEVKNIMSNLITHELAHLFIKKDYLSQVFSNNYKEKLKFIVFDEGFAHFLSLSENVFDFDFSKYTDKRNNAYHNLKEAYDNNDEKMQRIYLDEANTGAYYWDKFGAISGMFAISEYIGKNGNRQDKLVEIYEKGPNFLMDFILSQLG